MCLYWGIMHTHCAWLSEKALGEISLGSPAYKNGVHTCAHTSYMDNKGALKEGREGEGTETETETETEMEM